MDERFWKKVEKTEGCWNWAGKLGIGGYGLFRPGTKASDPWKRAHRLSYEEIVGAIPEGLDLDHLCRNRRCVNPQHLEPVTRRENLLRGETIPARNAAKTHCPQGHAYAGENLLVDGGRKCRTCVYARNREARRKRAKNRV